MKDIDVSIKDMKFTHLLRLIREIAIIIVCSYLAIRVFSGDLSLDFTKLSASELVSILLAFFSISLSAIFYFSASNSTSTFYHNANEFNQNISKLMGKLDEKVHTFDTRQSEMIASFNKTYKGESTDERNTDLETITSNISNLLDEKLTTDDNIPKKYVEIIQNELKAIKDNMKDENEDNPIIMSSSKNSSGEFTLRSHIRKLMSKLPDTKLSENPVEIFDEILQSGNQKFKYDLYKYGYTNRLEPRKGLDYTDKGIDFINKTVIDILF